MLWQKKRTGFCVGCSCENKILCILSGIVESILLSSLVRTCFVCCKKQFNSPLRDKSFVFFFEIENSLF